MLSTVYDFAAKNLDHFFTSGGDRMKLRRLLVGLVIFFSSQLISHASILEDKFTEWMISFSRVDLDNVGEETDLNLTWSWIASNGYHQVGIAANYIDIDFDDPLLFDSDGFAIGPIYSLNFTPTNGKITGFTFASYQTIGGDLGNIFDSEYSIGLGFKAFIGSSGSLFAFYALDKFQGATGFNDQDRSRLQVGFALYSGNRFKNVHSPESMNFPIPFTQEDPEIPPKPERSKFSNEQINAMVYQALYKFHSWKTGKQIRNGLPINEQEFQECIGRLIEKGMIDVQNFSSGPKYRLAR